MITVYNSGVPAEPKLVSYFERFTNLSPAFKQSLSEKIKYKKVVKGEFFFKEGNPAEELYFITKGLVRSYARYKGKEITLWINAETEIFTSTRGFVNNNVSDENIVACEDCELEYITKTDLNNLFNSFYESYILTRLILEQYYLDANERAFISKIQGAKDRYEYFLKSKKGYLMNRAALKYIASFLGIRLETFSRLRTSLKNNDKNPTVSY